MSLEEEKTRGRLSETVRISGYLVASGALVGFSAGVFLLFNRALFSFFVRIGQFETTGYFLGVFIPSFVILIVIGYLFATTLGPKKADLSNIVPLCVLSLLCMILSALSIFFFISFLGGFLTLMMLIKAYTKSTFKTLSKREAFFMVEAGAMFIASFSSLFLLTWFLSNVFQTFAMGFLGSYSPYALLLVGVLSFLLFFAMPLWGSRGTNAGLCGVLGLTISIVSYLLVAQNQYALFNATAYVGMFLLVLGFISELFGELLYIRLFLSEPAAPIILTSALLYQGSYCPYCGKPRATASQNSCSHCGRSLMWTPHAAFCSSCGRLVPTNAQVCPHCLESIENKRSYFQLRETQKQAIANQLAIESRRKKSWIMRMLLGVSQILHKVEHTLWATIKFFHSRITRLGLTLKDVVIIIALTYIFGFISFVGYKRIEVSEISSNIWLIHYGFPTEWLQLKYMYRPIGFVYGIEIMPIQLIFDIFLYFLLSFTLVYGTIRLRR